MGKSNKLTPEQNQFACQHLSLVKVFLFKNHLDQEFYDVVIFGYLDAVREYLENPELSRFRFSSIAWRKMKYCMIKEFLYLDVLNGRHLWEFIAKSAYHQIWTAGLQMEME